MAIKIIGVVVMLLLMTGCTLDLKGLDAKSGDKELTIESVETNIPE